MHPDMYSILASIHISLLNTILLDSRYTSYSRSRQEYYSYYTGSPPSCPRRTNTALRYGGFVGGCTGSKLPPSGFSTSVYVASESKADKSPQAINGAIHLSSSYLSSPSTFTGNGFSNP